MKPNMPKTPFATSLSSSAKETELRLRNIFQWKKKRPPVIALVVAVLVVVFCGSFVGFASQEERNSELVPKKPGLLAVEEVPGGVVYATGRFRSANLYWFPNGANAENAKLIRKGVSNVDLSTFTLTCEGNTLQLEYLQLDAPFDLDFNWDDMLKTIRYRVTGEVSQQDPMYPMYNALIDLDFGRTNLWVTNRYRVSEGTPPEYISGSAISASMVGK